MRKAIFATLEHSSSTDVNPSHEKCPNGLDSWCDFQRAAANGEVFEHPPATISPMLKEHLLPVYLDLSKDALLERCLGGHNQNANESFNATVWRLAPKHLNSGIKIVEIAAHLAAVIFNDGYTSILNIMQLMEIQIGPQTYDFTKDTDQQRCESQARRALASTKEARTEQRLTRTRENEFYEETEVLMYAPGIAD